jgi:hypothetical protein
MELYCNLLFFKMYSYLFNTLSKLTDRSKHDVEIFNKRMINSFAGFIKENRNEI